MSELLTVGEVASVMKCSEDAVSKIFSKIPGVIDLGRAENQSKRRYRVLRIPKTVVEKYLADKSGHPVRIEVPPRPERRRKSDDWENRAILNLAKAGKQNGATTWADRKTFSAIADRAAWLVRAVPEQYWSEISEFDWVDDEDRERL